MHKLVLIIMILSVLTACEITTYNPPETQSVYFEYEYINFAWGYQHNGWVIDADGNVRSWNLPDDWRQADSTGYIGEADLQFNVNQTDSIIAVVDSTELMDHVALIAAARNGSITKPENTANDAGSASLYCYWYDPDSNAYKKIFLASSGDFSSRNESEEAKQLVEWLKTFGLFWLEE